MSERDAGDIEGFLARELVPGEFVRWRGRPDPTPRVRASEVPIYLLALVPFVLGLMLFIAGVNDFNTDTAAEIEAGVQDTVGDLILTSTFSLVFMIFGAGIVGGRSILRRHRRRRTWYFLTDRRVMEVQLNARRRVLAVPLTKIAGVQSEVRRDGSGSISFGDGATAWAARIALSELPLERSVQSGLVFFDVPDVEELLDLLREEQWGQP